MLRKVRDDQYGRQGTRGSGLSRQQPGREPDLLRETRLLLHRQAAVLWTIHGSNARLDRRASVSSDDVSQTPLVANVATRGDCILNPSVERRSTCQ